ncbi:SDR family NAD(P)-dependent oxidoreductase [Streptomyces sp. NPDC058665]|uniref:SDR family NAD(P)-dependent oxidoreductase n=1 Tax=Streptomyces sp. NPDC058665 TaxID=3346586 RepID=UPI003664F314
MVERTTRNLSGATVIVTGASSGIGAAAAHRFAALGATVAVVGRSVPATKAVAQSAGGHAHFADFSRLDDVRRLAAELLERYPRIDVLANNAGALFSSHGLTPDGHERTFQIGHLAPFLLTTLLLDNLKQSPDARVIQTGSNVYRGGRIDLDDLNSTRRRYRMMRVYSMTKLATLLFTQELARRIHGTTVTTTAFHPGMTATNAFRDNRLASVLTHSWLSPAITPEKGAEPLLYLATTDDPGSVNGRYFHRFKHEEPRNDQARDAEPASKLWEHSAQLTQAPNWRVTH